MEFPHLLQLIERTSLTPSTMNIFRIFLFSLRKRSLRRIGLVFFDVEELPTHGGSLRIYGRHKEDASKPVSARV